MSFQLTHKLPAKCLVAVSGGIDSMVALHWLSQVKERVQGVVHMNHNTGIFAEHAQVLVEEISSQMGLPCHIRKLDRTPEEGHSPENWWREQRYRWFSEISATNENLPIVVAHNMDDCLEEYIMCTMVRGFQGTIPYAHGDCVRPFRLWKRRDIHDYAIKEGILWTEDPANRDTHKYKRAYIRHVMVPWTLELNPGIYKIVERVVREQDERAEETIVP